MLRNSPLALALLFAIAKARAVWVPINPAEPRRESRYLFNHSAPKLIIAERSSSRRSRRAARRSPARRSSPSRRCRRLRDGDAPPGTSGAGGRRDLSP
jgi:acyl-CoA synthetase (AMP-forming)/AMP-acid ligase II